MVMGCALARRLPNAQRKGWGPVRCGLQQAGTSQTAWRAVAV